MDPNPLLCLSVSCLCLVCVFSQTMTQKKNKINGLSIQHSDRETETAISQWCLQLIRDKKNRNLREGIVSHRVEWCSSKNIDGLRRVWRRESKNCSLEELCGSCPHHNVSVMGDSISHHVMQSSYGSLNFRQHVPAHVVLRITKVTHQLPPSNHYAAFLTPLFPVFSEHHWIPSVKQTIIC